ncbi:permease-like cell division protein FtsX [Actinoplanes bogorensis]|uniref:Permease-like cell division protein FtsX n=1 Tax=Paractinoplanes bogorensis TaxID=1610840 RepID=A0ABS5YGI9_9ACTN|nr:permease-like cell division protein FtsX [Actinoplanes bogorensis]MBU2662608.1 permease-like cell division protein FtsX [Actinoplanes bogorensis]
MSEPFVDVPPPPSPAPPTDRAARRVVLIAAVAVVSLLAGSAMAVAAVLLLGWRPQPERTYTVLVHLNSDVTTEQKAAIEQAVGQVPNAGAVKYTDKVTSLAKMKELLKDRPDLADTLTEKYAPESFETTVKTREMTCDGIPGIRKLPGVSTLKVIAPITKTRPPLEVVCY